jgi:hypothetical protein
MSNLNRFFQMSKLNRLSDVKTKSFFQMSSLNRFSDVKTKSFFRRQN